MSLLNLSLAIISSSILAVIISLSAFFAICIGAYFYSQWRNNKNDQMWQLNVDEIHFDDPVEVIGQGSFGVVVLAEYRGSKVAIKRAVRDGGKRGSTRGSKNRMGGSRGGSIGGSKSGRKKAPSNDGSACDEESDDDTQDFTIDIETGTVDEEPATTDSFGNSGRSNKSKGGSGQLLSDDYSLGFLGKSLGQQSKWTRYLPWAQKEDYQSRFKEAILGESTAGMSSTGFIGVFCPCFDEHKRRQKDFIEEMRVLSRLRHPW
jgi:serine/threonine protein kinase